MRRLATVRLLALLCLLAVTVPGRSQTGPGVARHRLLTLAESEQVLDVVTTSGLDHWVSVTTFDNVGPGTGGGAGSFLGRRLVRWDGALLGKHVRVPVRNVRFSPDGESMAFVSVSWGEKDFGRFRVFRDGEVLGPKGHYSGFVEMGAGLGPWFSPDGTHLAWPSPWKGRWRIVVDGLSPKGQTFDRVVMDHPWTPDGRLVSVVRIDGVESLLEDGVTAATADRIVPVWNRPAASWEAHPLAWVETTVHGTRLRRADEAGPWWEDVGEVAVGPGGARWAYAAVDDLGRAHVVVDGESAGEFDAVADVTFGPQGRLSFVAAEQGRVRLHVDGLTSPDFRRIDDFAFVPGHDAVVVVGRDGPRRHVLRGDLVADEWTQTGNYRRVFAVVAGPTGRVALSVEHMGRAAVFLDGRRLGPRVDLVRHCSLGFTPGGAHVAFVARLEGADALIVDGEVAARAGRVICPLSFEEGAVSFVGWTDGAVERVRVPI